MNVFELFNIHFSFYHWKHVKIDKFVKKLSFDNNFAKIVSLCYSQTPSYELKSGFLSKLIIILFRYQSELFCSKSQIRKCFCPNEPNLVKFEQKLWILEHTSKYTKLNRHPVYSIREVTKVSRPVLPDWNFLKRPEISSKRPLYRPSQNKNIQKRPDRRPGIFCLYIAYFWRFLINILPKSNRYTPDLNHF